MNQFWEKSECLNPKKSTNKHSLKRQAYEKSQWPKRRSETYELRRQSCQLLFTLTLVKYWIGCLDLVLSYQWTYQSALDSYSQRQLHSTPYSGSGSIKPIMRLLTTKTVMPRPSIQLKTLRKATPLQLQVQLQSALESERDSIQLPRTLKVENL